MASFWWAIVCITSPHYGSLELLKIGLKESGSEPVIIQTCHDIWMNLLELSNAPIGNILQMIVFLYCQNDGWIFLVLSFSYYHFVLQELLFLMVLANLIFSLWVKRYMSIKCDTIENTPFHSEQMDRKLFHMAIFVSGKRLRQKM